MTTQANIATEKYLAVKDVCAWPNLTLLPDGTIIAAIWNQPVHALWEGDLDCYASEDGGKTWNFRACIAPHEPGTNRMNCAAGLAKNGDLLVLVSGWSHRNPPPDAAKNKDQARPLRSWVCRSSDGGHTWNVTGELPPSVDGHYEYIPFGDLQVADDGALCVSTYSRDLAKGPSTPTSTGMSATFWRSYDDGQTWSESTLLNPIGNETAILHLGAGRWIAASRTEMDRHIDLCVSEDDGRSWKNEGALTKPFEVTGHLIRLRDGRVLFSYGNRAEGEYGVDFRISEDEGRTWSTPLRLIDRPCYDGGYPSSVQRDDGRIVTAYYNQLPGEYQYEMNALIWDVPESATL